MPQARLSVAYFMQHIAGDIASVRNGDESHQESSRLVVGFHVVDG
jgi:hypothetical protein